MAKFGWHTVAAAAYSAARYNFILNVEEARDAKKLPYKDSKGIATIGVGFNIKNTGANSPQDEVFKRILVADWEKSSEEQLYVKRLQAELAKTWTSNDALDGGAGRDVADYSAVTGAGLSVIMNGTNGTAAVGAATYCGPSTYRIAIG